MGPLLKAPLGKKFLLVATDYFTKWIEAEPLSRIQDVETKNFVWENIITRFGIPRAIISDNDAQFNSGLFREYCSGFGIHNYYSTPTYPECNGQVEVSNKTVLVGIKKRLERAKGRWTEELLNVL